MADESDFKMMDVYLSLLLKYLGFLQLLNSSQAMQTLPRSVAQLQLDACHDTQGHFIHMSHTKKTQGVALTLFSRLK